MKEVHTKVKLLFLFLFFSIFSIGQENILQEDSPISKNSSIALDTVKAIKEDTLLKNQFTYSDIISQKKRTKLLIAVTAATYTATMIGLNEAWYKNYPKRSFHFFNDNAHYLQMDKISHIWGAYTVSRVVGASWTWAGNSHKKSTWVGGIAGLGFQTIVEVLDGFADKWGFSAGDMLANIAGSATYVTQELIWKEQRIQIKFSLHLNDYSFSQQLNDRMNQYYGKGPTSRLMKDYNGQTYWLSFNLKSFFPHSNLPQWLNFSFGHGAENLYGGLTNTWTDRNGNFIDRSDIRRYRRFHIAPDIDLTKIKTKSKFLKALFLTLNSVKFPAPSIEFSQGKVKWNWIMF